MAPPIPASSTSLLDLLSNPLIFNLIIPHLPIQSVLALGSTSHAYHGLLTTSPDTFRYLDITTLPITQIDRTPIDTGGISWRSQRMDEALTEEEFFSGPLRGLFYSLEKQHILKNVNTLIMDGVDVTLDVLAEIILDPHNRFHVRILSIQVGRYLLMDGNEKISQLIRHAVRPDRPVGTPKLKAFYFFGSPSVEEIHGSDWEVEARSYLQASGREIPSEPWYLTLFPVCATPSSPSWGRTLEAAKGIISFDGILCRGPRHNPEQSVDVVYQQPTIAIFALGQGCMLCGTSPEGPAIYGKSPPEWLPLLSPPPITVCSVNAARRPTPLKDGSYPQLFTRCVHCITGRYCFKCRRWVCENCVDDDDIKKWITKYSDIQAGRVPTEFLKGHVYRWKSNIGRGTAATGHSLCLDKCMPEEFAERQDEDEDAILTFQRLLTHW
ncbi:hypothetical protein ABW19_dt0208628 [Dactylella cylindrospora]|nr:hypothetical protein ABW19_dt0208628 [Dactylella cylindrospora]